MGGNVSLARMMKFAGNKYYVVSQASTNRLEANSIGYERRLAMLRFLRNGMNGPDVLAVQQGLNIRGIPLGRPRIAEDGIFGPGTDRAVRDFQGRNHLVVDGVVGPVTRSVLFPLAAVTVNIFGTRIGPVPRSIENRLR